MNRKGLTLVELLVTMALFGILGTALAQLLISNSRFVSLQEAMLEARQTARASAVVLGTEIRMVGAHAFSGSPSASQVTLRVPFAIGMLCGTDGAARVGALAPVDAAVYDDATPDGVFVRSGITSYQMFGSVIVNSSTTVSACLTEGVDTIPGGHLVQMTGTGAPGLGGAEPGTPFVVFQTVTYSFGASTLFSGRRGLWRQANGQNDEVAAPFADDAEFGYLVDNGDTLGIELRLFAESVSTPPGGAGPQRFDLVNQVRFQNRGN